MLHRNENAYALKTPRVVREYSLFTWGETWNSTAECYIHPPFTGQCTCRPHCKANAAYIACALQFNPGSLFLF